MDEFDKIRAFSEGMSKQSDGHTSQNIENHMTADDDASLYEFKAGFEDRIGSYPLDDLEEKRLSSMKMHFVAFGIFVGVLIVVLGGFFMFGTSGDHQTEMITIQATPEPVKVKPQQPGGMVIPDQDKLVYNRIRSNQVDTQVETLFPEPEKPVMPAILSIEQKTPDTPFVAMEEVKTFDPLAENNQQVQSDTTQKNVAHVEQIPLTEVAKKEMPKVAEVQKPVTQPKENKAVETTVGEWSVQLMSSSNKKTVEQAWPKLMKKHQELLSDMPYKITTAEIAGKGTFYRLRVGNFKTRNQANALCNKLKAVKQDCIPAK